MWQSRIRRRIEMRHLEAVSFTGVEQKQMSGTFFNSGWRASLTEACLQGANLSSGANGPCEGDKLKPKTPFPDVYPWPRRKGEPEPES